MNKIKKFFRKLWDYMVLPYCWLTTRKIDKKLTQIAEEDRMSLITEEDVEFLKGLGIKTDCKSQKSDGKKDDKSE